MAYLQKYILKCQEEERNITVVIIHFHVLLSFLFKENVKSKDDIFNVLAPTMQIQREEFL